MPDAAVSSYGSKDVSFLRKMDVINLFIVSYELCKNCLFFDVPDGASGVNGASSDEVVELRVPVERCERG